MRAEMLTELRGYNPATPNEGSTKVMVMVMVMMMVMVMVMVMVMDGDGDGDGDVGKLAGKALRVCDILPILLLSYQIRCTTNQQQ